MELFKNIEKRRKEKVNGESSKSKIKHKQGVGSSR